METEREARRGIDAALAESGWAVQPYAAMNHSAAAGPHRPVAVGEFEVAPGHGTGEHLHFLDGQVVGVQDA